MIPPVRENDLELLSAYLDNQLPERDKLQLERRLAAEPDLKDALAGLRATVHAMRSLPPVKVPRNFTLDPRVYAGRKPARALGGAYGLLRLGTALAAFLFVVAVAGDLLARSNARSLAVSPQAAAPLAGEQALAPTQTPEVAAFAAEAATVAETEAPPRGPTEPTGLLLEGGGRTEGGGGGVGGGGEGEPEAGVTQPAAALSAPTAAEESAAPAAPAEGTPNASRQAADQAVASETPQASASPTSSAKAAPSETPLAVAQAPAQAPAPAPPAAVPTSAPFDWLRPAQVALGLLAVALGLATLWARSRNR